MKMGTAIFWGIVLILVGLGMVLKVIFKVDFPIFKVLIAFLFIYIGIKMLIGNFGIFGCNMGNDDAVFGKSYIEGIDENRSEYNAVFGKTTINLRDVVITEKTKIEVNAIFGGVELRIDKEMPLKVKVDVVFGGADLPDGGTGGFGTSVYTSKNFNPDEPYLFVRANIIFGGLQIID
jgi:predicted membrane protein